VYCVQRRSISSCGYYCTRNDDDDDYYYSVMAPTWRSSRRRHCLQKRHFHRSGNLCGIRKVEESLSGRTDERREAEGHDQGNNDNDIHSGNEGNAPPSDQIKQHRDDRQHSSPNSLSHHHQQQHSPRLLTHSQIKQISSQADSFLPLNLEQQFYAPKPMYEEREDESIAPAIQRQFINRDGDASLNNFYIFTDEDVDHLNNEEYTYPLKYSPYFQLVRETELSRMTQFWNEDVKDRDLEIAVAHKKHVWQFPWNRSLRLMRITRRLAENISDEHKPRILTEWRFHFQHGRYTCEYKSVEVQIHKGIRVANFYLRKYAKIGISEKELDELMITEEDLPSPPVMPAEVSNKESAPTMSEYL